MRSETVSLVITGVYLLVLSVEDMLHRKLRIYLILTGFAALAVSLYVNTGPDYICRLAGVIPGLFLVGISLISKGRLGMGDALVVCVLGPVLGVYGVTAVTALAFGMLTIYTIAMLALGRVGKNARIAFVPFLLAGFILTCAEGI